jgi:predicted MPP superfamily phosphohydrolase
VKKGINIVGIDDYFLDSKKELKLLNHLSQKDLTIVLKHRPIVSKESIGLFDLQLSGHTHGGQIFPFRLITRVFFENVSGYKILNERSRLYVSRGMGTWGPPLRVFSPPEVTVIDLLSNDFKRPRSESNM